MARTRGSGWGGGVLLFQICPFCGKKKVFYDWFCNECGDFRCTSCKKRFHSDKLHRIKYLNEGKIKKVN